MTFNFYRGATFADDGEFDRCIQLWLHALHLKTDMKARNDREISQFAQLFCLLLDSGQSLKFDDFIQVFKVSKNGLEAMSHLKTGQDIKRKIDRERAELMVKDFR